MVLWGYYCQWCATLSSFEEFVRALICGEKLVRYPFKWYGYPNHPGRVKDIHHAWFPIFICPCFYYIEKVLLAGDSSTKEIMLDGLGSLVQVSGLGALIRDSWQLFVVKVVISRCEPLLIFMQTVVCFSGNTILAGFVGSLVYRTMSHWILSHIYNFPCSFWLEGPNWWGVL